MGSGIAQVFAQNGFDVILFDVNDAILSKAKTRIEKFAPGISENIKFTSSIDECRADIIIEAIIENADAKVDLFNKLIEINDNKTIFTTNTSSLSVTDLLDKISKNILFAGLHFFNPAPLMKLVEIVKIPGSSSQIVDSLSSIVKTINKTPVVCNDSPGFIVNRVARPYYLEALYLVEKYSTTIENIDQVMEATGFRMGPFKLMDLIGNDINYSVSCIVHESLGKPERLKPSAIQQKKVKEGALGRKTGKGYYEYPVV